MPTAQQVMMAIGTPAASGTPSDIPNIWEWWEPSREGLADTDPIITLTGQVAPGVGHNWGQATSGNRPTYLDNQINGLGVANFTVAGANSDWMDGVNPSALTAVHFFIVIKIPTDPPATVQVPWALGTDSGNPDVYPFTSGSILAGVFSNARKTVGDPAISLAAWRVVEVVSVSGEWTWRIDGATSGTGVYFTTAVNTEAELVNCVLGGDSNGQNNANEDIAGIYIFSAKLTTDRADMVTYLNDRFALSMT